MGSWIARDMRRLNGPFEWLLRDSLTKRGRPGKD